MVEAKVTTGLLSESEKSRTGTYILVIGIVPASIAFIIGRNSIGFTESAFWKEFFIYAFIGTAALIASVYLCFIVEGKKLLQSSIGSMKGLRFLGLTVVLSLFASHAYMKLLIPELYTQLVGQQAEMVMIAKKELGTGGKSCGAYLNIRHAIGSGNVDRICLNENINKYPEYEFHAKLIGKQSKISFLIKSIEVAEQP